MRGLVLWGGGLTGLLLTASLSCGQYLLHPVSRLPILPAPDACGPGWYGVGTDGVVYGPNYYLQPPWPPHSGITADQFASAAWAKACENQAKLKKASAKHAQKAQQACKEQMEQWAKIAKVMNTPCPPWNPYGPQAPRGPYGPAAPYGPRAPYGPTAPYPPTPPTMNLQRPYPPTPPYANITAPTPPTPIFEYPQPGEPGFAGEPGTPPQAFDGLPPQTVFPTHPFVRSPRDFFMLDLNK